MENKIRKHTQFSVSINPKSTLKPKWKTLTHLNTSTFVVRLLRFEKKKKFPFEHVFKFDAKSEVHVG